MAVEHAPDIGPLRRRETKPGESARLDREVSELCHDLRQPIAALSQLAAAATTTDLPATTRERLTQISHEAQRLRGMVQTVLAAPPTWEPVDLAQVARETVRSAQVTYRGELGLSVRDPAVVLGRPVQLDRALSNLIDNAVHASGTAGRVHVDVRAAGDEVRVTVDDDGPGLLRNPGRVSLGLLIVDQVVREHAGDVTVEDSVLGGARVEMSFPAAAVRRGARRGVLSVVLCDDHRLFVESLAVVLQERGWDVIAVLDRPDAAVDAVTRHRPDICVLDALFDGDVTAAIAAAAQIRDTSPETRVVVLSGSGEPEVVGAAVTAGAAGYVLKTCEIETITSCIERVAAGEAVVDAELARRAILHQSAPQDAAVQLTRYLTCREREVLGRLARGEDTGAIADRMGIRPTTARSHIQNVLAKLGVHSRLEAVVLAARCGIGA